MSRLWNGSLHFDPEPRTLPSFATVVVLVVIALFAWWW